MSPASWSARTILTRERRNAACSSCASVSTAWARKAGQSSARSATNRPSGVSLSVIERRSGPGSLATRPLATSVCTICVAVGAATPRRWARLPGLRPSLLSRRSASAWACEGVTPA